MTCSFWNRMSCGYELIIDYLSIDIHCRYVLRTELYNPTHQKTMFLFWIPWSIRIENIIFIWCNRYVQVPYSFRNVKLPAANGINQINLWLTIPLVNFIGGLANCGKTSSVQAVTELKLFRSIFKVFSPKSRYNTAGRWYIIIITKPLI